MKKPFVPYLQTASSIRDVPIVVRGKIFAYAVGMAVGCNTPLPASPLTDIDEYYVQHVERSAARIVSEFNESTIMDVKHAMIVAKNVWRQRYDIAHQCPRLESSGGFFNSMFSVDVYYSASEVEFLNENQKNIARLYNICCPLVGEMMVAGSGDQQSTPI